ncbi:thrombospondin type 3 repeat-containing protein [candidate division CSSED10-310 bacterium]|uniref:Thrombospondin type 3 repeat-containing protein n=1 Tax=candidate division CSSED10-310 bacterium TaxID=2855610 RepID=A0ABV6Z5F4_UNCC1
MTMIFVLNAGAQDWNMGQYNIQRNGFSPSSAPDTENLLWSFQALAGITAQPVIVNGKVYIGSDDKRMYCLDTETGNVVWQYETTYGGGAPISSTATVVDGKVYFSVYGPDYGTYCLDAETGSLIWRVNIGTYASPIVAEGKLYTKTNNRIYCLDAQTGTYLWENNSFSGLRNSFSMNNGKLYMIQSSDGLFLHCVEAATGTVLWSVTLDESGGANYPVIVDGKIYLSFNNQVACLNENDGSVVWNFGPTGGYLTTPVVAYGKVYFKDQLGLYCLDAATGVSLWDPPIYVYVSPGLIVADNKVYLGTQVTGDHSLKCFDAETGALHFSSSLNHYGFAPAVADGKVYIASFDGTLYCYGAPDTDGDGVPDDLDNCDNTPNPGQEDFDGDGVGDVCDTEYLIDPGDYAGDYYLIRPWTEVTGPFRGTQMFDLDPHQWFLAFGSLSYHPASFYVESDGSVTIHPDSLDKLSVAGEQNNIVLFNNILVRIARGNYGKTLIDYENKDYVDNNDPIKGYWEIYGVVEPQHDDFDVTLIPGVRWDISLGRHSGMCSFAFYVDQAGQFEMHENNLNSATGSFDADGVPTLTFNTVDIAVNYPGGFSGKWAIYLDVIPWQEDDGSPEDNYITLVPDVTGYYNGYIYSWFATECGFKLDGEGNVIPREYSWGGHPITGGNLEITFNTMPIYIDAVDYCGSWQILRNIYPASTGNETLNLAVGARYRALIGSAGYFDFLVTDTGMVQDIQAIGSTQAVPATGGEQTLSFNTVPISVDMGDFPYSWQLRGVLSCPEPDFIVVPGLTYSWWAWWAHETVINYFTVDEVEGACTVDPSTIEVELGDVIYEITVSCGLPDIDGDGVADDVDNCPAIPNGDQLDQDDDGIGDACDDDLDGDGVLNVPDNCEDIFNPDQSDLDGDEIGDACDDDDDGDSVPDSEDNCNQIPNTDQADNDSDDLGDVCDDNDDLDTIIDELDNCPRVTNEDQADLDGDGIGDACDDDMDGDGVLNEDDLCPESPANQIVNADGCTGAQFIWMTCLPEDFVQHGQYVKCVSHAAKEAVEQGLITPQEKSRFIKEAAKTK